MRRFIVAAALAAAVIAPLVVWKEVGHIDHAAPAPAAIQAESDQLAHSLGLQPVPIYQIDIERTGEAGCYSDGKCDIHLGKSTIETPYWTENAGAFRALLAHELGHIVQAQRGERYESLLLPLIYGLAIACIIAIGTGRRWWLVSGIWFAGLTWGPPWYSGFFRTWDEIFHWAGVGTFAIASTAALYWCVAGFDRKRQNAQRLARTSVIIAGVSMCSIGTWSYARTFETQPLKMELDADRIAACLAGTPNAIAHLELIEKEVAAGRGAKDDLFHSTPAIRIAKIKALNLKTQCRDVYPNRPKKTEN